MTIFAIVALSCGIAAYLIAGFISYVLFVIYSGLIPRHPWLFVIGWLPSLAIMAILNGIDTWRQENQLW